MALLSFQPISPCSRLLKGCPACPDIILPSWHPLFSKLFLNSTLLAKLEQHTFSQNKEAFALLFTRLCLHTSHEQIELTELLPVSKLAKHRLREELWNSIFIL